MISTFDEKMNVLFRGRAIFAELFDQLFDVRVSGTSPGHYFY